MDTTAPAPSEANTARIPLMRALAAGIAAGRSGASLESNPFPGDQARSFAFLRGYQLGLK